MADRDSKNALYVKYLDIVRRSLKVLLGALYRDVRQGD